MFRAYDTTTEWMGRARATLDEARKDAARHNEGCRRQRGYGSAVVIAEDPSCPGRSVYAEAGRYADAGDPVWPPHGQGCGSVRWPSEVTP